MAYSSPVTRMGIYGGIRLGTELVSIIPGSQRMGPGSSADIDKDTAFIGITSPNMEFNWNVIAYLDGAAVAGNTKQIALHMAFLQEMSALQSAGLKFNDLVWIDDISRHTTVNGGGPFTGPQTNLNIAVTTKAALGTLVTNQSYLWIGSLSAKKGFFAKYEGGDSTHVIVDVPGAVLLGGVTEEEARQVDSGYDVYFVNIGYHRCKYQGQQLPEVSEGSMDTERFGMSYQFVSDTIPNFEGEA